VNGVNFAYFSANTRWSFDRQVLHSDVNNASGQGGFLA
jgi:hypothetical protein